MLLEKNEKFSSTRNTHHIGIWYYFITDYLKQHQDLSIEYYLTGNMIGDYFTKSLTGSQFQKKCKLIFLGIDNNKIPQYNEEYNKYANKEIEKMAEV